MIKVAVVYYNSANWMGGVNFSKNLFHAIEKIKNPKIQVVLFTKRGEKVIVLKRLYPHLLIQESLYFTNFAGFWRFMWNFFMGLIQKITGMNYFDYLMKKNDIDVCSHSWKYGDGLTYKTINWIPDFQHIHLPELFPKEEIEYRNKKYIEVIKKSDRILLSSYDVLSDFKKFAPDFIHKARKVSFVSYIDKTIYDPKQGTKVLKSYGIRGKYFYIPNQFWKHKNHLVIFDALRILNKKNMMTIVVFSGFQEDKRDKSYFAKLLTLVNKYNIQKNIKILGLIPHKDALYLMRYSISVINPSLFEGWSNTVEEAKSLGKNIILSDLPVHREQNPPGATYFQPHNALQLSNIMLKKSQENTGGPDVLLEKKARFIFQKRFRTFGIQYQKIVMELFD